jgi:hypothetical protein
MGFDVGSNEPVQFALKKEVHAMMVYRGNVDEVALILNLGTRCS